MEISDDSFILVDEEVLESLMSSGRYGFVKVVEKDSASFLRNGYTSDMKIRPADLYGFYGDALRCGGIGYSAIIDIHESGISIY